jgi:hypothetical protein
MRYEIPGLDEHPVVAHILPNAQRRCRESPQSVNAIDEHPRLSATLHLKKLDAIALLMIARAVAIFGSFR